MTCMGFGTKWCKWILACLKSASISILVNGSPTKEFSIGRGVRQGDPLSPFLFILAAEGLNILTKAAFDRGLFKGVEIGGDKVAISHLQYADDTMFFGEWSNSNARNLINILKCFELSSGLKVNFQKSCLYGVGDSMDEVERLASRMHCQAGKFPFIYLGLPIGAKMKKISDWTPVIDKFKKRLSEWKMRTLSFGGNAIEDCDVAFKNSFNKSIGDGKSTLFWKDNWCGSACLKDLFPRLYMLESNKDAMVSDRISSAPSSRHTGTAATEIAAAASVVVSDAGGGCEFPAVVFGSRPNSASAQRNSAHHSPPLGNRAGIGSQNASSCCISWSWLRDPRGRTLNELVEIENLLKSFQFDFNTRESWKWGLANNGIFTVKKLSSLLDTHILGNPIGSKRTLRNNLVPKKIEIFIWRSLKKRIPVRIELDKRGIDLHSVRCHVCDDGLESVDHSLIECKYARDVWTRLHKWWNFGSCSFSNVGDIEGNLAHSSSTLGHRIWQAVVWVCAYYLWKNRNLMAFSKDSWSASVLVSEIQVKSFEWISNRIKGKFIDWLNWLVSPQKFLDL
ncbi:uncharacterized protein [Rutidosis leptorrhynchoides]|uniref:uncharacterized protein n=1 Tax=Rutidosis leptorrhynchoides TaxID=125765 RepID=UPI003A9A32D8